MKRIFYFICFIILLFLISIIPTSAKEIKTCTRTDNNLHVKESYVNKKNLDDIMLTPCVLDSDKVYDFADLLTDEEEDNLYNEVKEYIDITNYDLAIVTIDKNPKLDAMNYADDFYDYNSFGKNETNDGSLILIDMDTRELYISTSGYAIKMYDDTRIDSVLDDGYSYITNEDYYNTISSMIKKLNYFYDLGFPSSNENLVIDEYGHAFYIKYINYPLLGIIAGIVTLIVSIVFYNISRLKIKVGSTISYLKNKNINLQKDTLVNSIVTHHLRNTDTGSGGSNSGGGSSFHTSSSGASHGGGGRHF